MWLLSLLFVYGLLPFLSCEECIQRILECSKLRVRAESKKFLPDTDETLEELCRVQGPYIKCVFDVALSCSEELSTTIKLKFLNNEDFFEQFCKRGSHWWIKYLENSRCINEQNYNVCVVSENIEALKDQSDREKRCWVLNRILACAATIVLDNCGAEAENLFLSLVVLAADYDFKCSVIGKIDSGKPNGSPKKSTSPDSEEEINQLNVNLGLERDFELSDIEDENEDEETILKDENEDEETILNLTEILRRIGSNVQDETQSPSMSPATQEQVNTKLYDESTDIPLVTPVTSAAELHEGSLKDYLREAANARSGVETEIPLTERHEGPQEEYLKGSDEYFYSDDTESSSLEETNSEIDSPHIKYLGNVRYHKDRPKEFVIDLSKNFAARAMSFIRRILNPNLNIEAFKYSDETVRVYWEHPFVLPFETLLCREADIRERFFAKSFTCIVTL